MDTSTETFERLRPRMMGIAYRMLGSSAEAEEVVQDVWLRWHANDGFLLEQYREEDEELLTLPEE